MKKIFTYFMVLCLSLFMVAPMPVYAAESQGTENLTEFYTELSGNDAPGEVAELPEDDIPEKTMELSASDIPEVFMGLSENEVSGKAAECLENDMSEESTELPENEVSEESAEGLGNDTLQEGTQYPETSTEEMETQTETDTEAPDDEESSTEEPSGSETDKISECGTVIVITTDMDSREKRLPGAVFAVYTTEGGQKVGELMTGADGTASLELPAGSYILREVAAPDGYLLSDTRLSFVLQAESVQELTVANSRIQQAEDETDPGALRITKRDTDSGQRLNGAVFGIYHTGTDNRVKEITTDRRGVAETQLAPGDYYYLELEAPDGYVLEEEKTDFSIKSGRTTEITVKNRKEESTGTEGTNLKEMFPLSAITALVTAAPVAENESIENTTNEAFSAVNNEEETTDIFPMENFPLENAAKTGSRTVESKNGTLRIENSAAGTGAKLSGSVFAVYGNGNKKMAELSVRNGKASLSLPGGDYYLKELKAAPGYGVEAARIRFSVIAGQVTVVEVTSETNLLNTNPQDLIPKTGGNLPRLPYILSVLCFLTAVLCGLKLRHMKKEHDGLLHGCTYTLWTNPADHRERRCF